MGGDGCGAVEATESTSVAPTAPSSHCRISLGSTVGSFKSVLAQNCDIPTEQQRLIYKGRILKDDQTLESYALEELGEGRGRRWMSRRWIGLPSRNRESVARSRERKQAYTVELESLVTQLEEERMQGF